MRIDLSEKRVKAELEVAFNLGFLDSPKFEDFLVLYEVERERRAAYGSSFNSFESFEITVLSTFRAFFSEGAAKYDYKEIGDDDIERYFSSNQDLFTRYFGEPFTLDECRDVVIKRIREEEYEGLIRQQLQRM